MCQVKLEQKTIAKAYRIRIKERPGDGYYFLTHPSIPSRSFIGRGSPGLPGQGRVNE